MLWIRLFIVEKMTYHAPIFGQFLEGAPIYTTITGAYFYGFFIRYSLTQRSILHCIKEGKNVDAQK